RVHARCSPIRQPPPTTPLFPYTTLFRSTDEANGTANQLQLGVYREGGYATLDSIEMPFTVEEDTWYRVLIQRDGDWLRGKMWPEDRKSTRLNSSHVSISYAVFCLTKKRR